MRALAALLFVGALLVAGCASPPAPQCEGDPCPSTTTTGKSPGPSDSPTPTTTLPIMVGLPVFAFDNCTGLSMATEIPGDVAADHVPDDFVPSSQVPFFARLGFTALSCPRVVHANRTYTDVAIIASAILVEPKESSWGADGFSLYSYDLMISNQTLADLLVGFGVPAIASTFTKNVLPGAGEVATQEWVFSSSGPTYKITAQHSMQTQNAKHAETRYHWTGSGEYRRYIIQDQDQVYAPGVHSGTLEVTGPSKFREALGRDNTAIDGSVRWWSQWVLAPDSRVFSN